MRARPSYMWIFTSHLGETPVVSDAKPKNTLPEHKIGRTTPNEFAQAWTTQQQPVHANWTTKRVPLSTTPESTLIARY